MGLIMLGRQNYTAEPLVPEPSAFDVEMAVGKLKKDKSPGTDQKSAELIKAGGRTIHCEIHKIINSILNKEELPEEWKESIIAPTYKKGDKTDFSNDTGISLLSPTYKILYNNMMSRLTPYSGEIIAAHQCGFRRKRSTTDHIFCIRQMLEKKWEDNDALYQLFTNFQKAYDSIRREVLYNNFNEFGTPMKLVRLIQICLNETYTRDRVGKHVSDTFAAQNGLK